MTPEAGSVPPAPSFLEDIEIVFDTSRNQSKKLSKVAGEPQLQTAPVFDDVIVIGVGTAGMHIADAIVATCEACGRGVNAGYIDLIDIRHDSPFVQPLHGLSFPLREHYVLGRKAGSLDTARDLYGEAWESEMAGIPYAELAARGDGGAGYRQVSRAYLKAEEQEVRAFLRRLFKRLKKDERSTDDAGFAGTWRLRAGNLQEHRRIRVIVCAGTAGCVGRGIALTVLAIARQMAEKEDFEVEPMVVAVGGLPYGEAGVPVHDRIAENARTWLDEVAETVNTNTVRFGPGHLRLSGSAILSPGSILYFNDELGEDDRASNEARQAYLAQIGLTAATGIFTGAFEHANTLDSVLAPADAVVRRARIYGHGINRGQVAALLNETRSSRLWQLLLDALEGNNFPGTA
jgi:hypothetical protein